MEIFEYEIIDISDQDIENYEQMGTKSKFWYVDSNTGVEYLFKSIHTEDRNGNKIERIGEDWAEKIACEIAEVLGIPHAEYDLATYNGERGIRSKKFNPPGSNMFFGNHLIEHIVNSSQATLEKGQRSQTISRVEIILKNIIQNPPLGWEKTERITSALDVFIGYLLFDVLISNQDRHNENWAEITIGSSEYLAPSFDHAASLGRNESIETMNERLTTKDEGRKIPTYVAKSKSWFYDKGKRLKTLDAFINLGYQSKKATLEWLERVEKMHDQQLFDIVFKVPDEIMGSVEKTFCLSMLIANKARVLAYKSLFEESEE